jgi:hypothetical protein
MRAERRESPGLRATGEAPILLQCRQIGALTVGEQDREQGDVRKQRDDRVIGTDVDDRQTTRPDEGAGDQKEQRGGQHRPGRDTRQ